jgi:hypothetical protein
MVKRFFEMYVLSVIYLQPLNPKSTASGASGASMASGASQESLESSASGPSEGENGRLKIDVAENVRSLLHFRSQWGEVLYGNVALRLEEQVQFVLPRLFLSALPGGPCGKLHMWITPSSKKTIVSTSPETGVSSGEPPRHAKGTPSYVTPMILFRPWMDRIFIFFVLASFLV